MIRLDVQLNTDGTGGLDLHVARRGGHAELDFDVDGILGLFDWLIRGIVRNQLEDGLCSEGSVSADLLDEAEQTENSWDIRRIRIGTDAYRCGPKGIDCPQFRYHRHETATRPLRVTQIQPEPPGFRRRNDSLQSADSINLLLAQVWQAGGLKVTWPPYSTPRSALHIALKAWSLSVLIGESVLLL